MSSIKFSNKSNTIEVTNNSITYSSNQNSQNNLPLHNQNLQNNVSESLINIDSPMVDIVYLTPKPSSHHLLKKVKR